jgi:hypothetical protein
MIIVRPMKSHLWVVGPQQRRSASTLYELRAADIKEHTFGLNLPPRSRARALIALLETL